MSFTSGKTSHDPEPWVVGSPIDGRPLRSSCEPEPTVPVDYCEYSPRPEFDKARQLERGGLMFGFSLCLFHAHQWGRLTVFSISGRKHMYEERCRCHVLRRAVIL